MIVNWITVSNSLDRNDFVATLVILRVVLNILLIFSSRDTYLHCVFPSTCHIIPFDCYCRHRTIYKSSDLKKKKKRTENRYLHKTLKNMKSFSYRDPNWIVLILWVIIMRYDTRWKHMIPTSKHVAFIIIREIPQWHTVKRDTSFFFFF